MVVLKMPSSALSHLAAAADVVLEAEPGDLPALADARAVAEQEAGGLAVGQADLVAHRDDGIEMRRETRRDDDVITWWRIEA